MQAQWHRYKSCHVFLKVSTGAVRALCTSVEKKLVVRRQQDELRHRSERGGADSSDSEDDTLFVQQNIQNTFSVRRAGKPCIRVVMWWLAGNELALCCAAAGAVNGH